MPATEDDGWQTYTNPLGFSIRYPATWSQEELPQQAGETIHTVTLQGAEGMVDLHGASASAARARRGTRPSRWRRASCPPATAKNADGTEVWTQIGKELEATSFSADARTSNADPASHDLVLAVLATLSFPPPEQSTSAITPRMLIAPNALVGPSPSSFNWSPVGTELAYVDAQDERMCSGCTTRQLGTRKCSSIRPKAPATST